MNYPILKAKILLTVCCFDCFICFYLLLVPSGLHKIQATMENIVENIVLFLFWILLMNVINDQKPHLSVH